MIGRSFAGVISVAALLTTGAALAQTTANIPTGYQAESVATNTLAASTTSASVALTSVPIVWVTNTGNHPVCVTYGATPTAVWPCAVGNGGPGLVGAGQTAAFNVLGAANLAAVTGTGTTSLSLVEGYVVPIPPGGTISGTVTIGAGSAQIGTVSGSQTGAYTDRAVSTPTVQNASYSSGNCVGGFNSVTFQGTGPLNLVNDIRLISQGGGTETLTVYVFDQNPTGSTCTDKGTFTLVTADTAKLLLAPFALTLAAQTGATQSFGSNPNIARIPKSGTTTLYYALVAGGTFTPATTTDILVGFQVVQQHQ